MPEPSSVPPRSPKLLIQLLLLVSLLGVFALLQRPDGRVHVWFFETAGDAALIRTPSGKHILIDGGSDAATLASQLGRVLPYWQRTIDMVILTRSDSAYLPGQVATLVRYRANAAWIAPRLKPNPALDAWRRLLAAEGTPIRRLQAGDRVVLDQVVFSVTFVSKNNNAGTGVLMHYGDTRILFAHSLASAAYLNDAARMHPVDLLVYPWEYAPPFDVLETLRPAAMILSDGAAAEEPTRRTFWDRSGGRVRLYHERVHGLIEWISDGQRCWIVTERQLQL